MKNCVSDLINLIVKITILKRNIITEFDSNIFNACIDNLNTLDYFFSNGFKLTPAIREALQIAYLACSCLLDNDSEFNKNLKVLEYANIRLEEELIVNGFIDKKNKRRI